MLAVSLLHCFADLVFAVALLLVVTVRGPTLVAALQRRLDTSNEVHSPQDSLDI